MSSVFYIDSAAGKRVTYLELIASLNASNPSENVCVARKSDEIFLRVLAAYAFEANLVVLDERAADSKTQSVLPQESASPVKKIVPSLDHLIDLLEKNRQTKIRLYTSGTTGLPKYAEHTFESLTRGVRRSEGHRSDVWGLAYNASHIAGLQVMFQAFMNENCIVDLFGLSAAHILEAIERHKISHISATPTFFRMLKPIQKQYPSIRRITMGGECFDSRTAEYLREYFPNAEFRNIYATTETGNILIGKGDAFVVQPSLEGRVKILDGELAVHKSLVDDRLRGELVSDWYRTGDVVEIVSENPLTFKIRHRKNELINVGGYKVNPLDVESALKAHSKIADALVYGRSNSAVGNVLSCDIVRQDESVTEKDIRLFLNGRLQSYEIPRDVRFVSSLKTTKTGKKARHE